MIVSSSSPTGRMLTSERLDIEVEVLAEDDRWWPGWLEHTWVRRLPGYHANDPDGTPRHPDLPLSGRTAPLSPEEILTKKDEPEAE